MSWLRSMRRNRKNEYKETTTTRVKEVLRLGDASTTVRSIKHMFIEGMQAIVEDNQVKKSRINAKITFVVEDDA